MVPAALSHSISSAHPGLQVVDADAGRAVNIEAAAVFNRAVLDFIAQH